MKKIIVLMIIVMMVLIGCGSTGYDDYIEAMDKTEQLTKATIEIESTFEIVVDEDEITAEEIEESKKYSKIIYDSLIQYDDEANKAIALNYSSIGAYGFDSEMYIDGDNQVLFLPFADMYMKIDSPYSDGQNDDFSKDDSYLEIFEIISKAWEHVLEEGNVFKGEQTLLETPNGEVKVDKYTISLTDEQLQSMLEEVMSDEKTIELLMELTKSMNLQDNMLDLPQLMTIIDKIHQMELDRFEFVSYIDVDGYVTSNEMNIVIKTKELNGIESMNFSMKSKLYNIGKDMDMELPDIDYENLKDFDGEFNFETFIKEN